MPLLPKGPNTKAYPESQFDKKVYSLLEDLAAVRSKKREFYNENQKVLDSWQEMDADEAKLIEAVKPLVRIAAETVQKSGKRELLKFGGTVVFATGRKSYKAAELLAKYPKLVKYAKMTIGDNEIQKLLAASVLSPEEVEKFVTYTAAISVEIE